MIGKYTIIAKLCEQFFTLPEKNIIGNGSSSLEYTLTYYSVATVITRVFIRMFQLTETW